MLKMFSKQVLLPSALVILSSVIVAGIVYSEIAAREYIKNVRSSASTARSAAKTLEKSVNSPLLNNPAETSSTRKADAQELKSAIAQCRIKVNELSTKSDALPTLNYAEHIGTFAAANTMKERSKRAVNQMRDTLDRYDLTVSFLETYTASLEKSAKILDEFNAIHNFNDYAGRPNYFRHMAATLQTEADTISQSTAPAELAEMQGTAVERLQQLSTQLNDLAYGVDVGVDDIIYNAVKEIETANTQFTTLTKKNYRETTSRMRVVKDVHTLSEKFNVILAKR